MTVSRSLLACDMDGTVIPLSPERRWRRDVDEFRLAVEGARDFLLAYVTGRDFAKAVDGVQEHRLPLPDFLVCDVGTSVYHRRDERYRTDPEYAGKMTEALGGLDASEIRHRLASLSDLRLQPEDSQTPFKISYFLAPDKDHSAALGMLTDRLGPAAKHIQTVYSVRTSDGTGLVDLLPAGVAKDFGLHYLRERTGTSSEALVFAGDSGNDLAALLAGFKAIVVGNTEASLKDEIRRLASAEGIQDRIYFSERPYAGGVLEGCRHFGTL